MVQKSYEKPQNWNLTEQDLSKTLVERSKGKKDRLQSAIQKTLLDLYKKIELPEELAPYVGEKIHKDGNKLVLVVAPYFQVDKTSLTIKENDLINNVDEYYNKGNKKFGNLYKQRNALLNDAKKTLNSDLSRIKELLEKDLSNKETFEFNIDFEHMIFHWFLPRPITMTKDEFFFSKDCIKPKEMSLEAFEKIKDDYEKIMGITQKTFLDTPRFKNIIYTHEELWKISEKATERILEMGRKFKASDNHSLLKNNNDLEKMSLENCLVQDQIRGYKLLKQTIDIVHPDIILFIGNKTKLVVNVASFNYQKYEDFLKSYRYKKDRFKKFERYLEKSKIFADLKEALSGDSISPKQKQRINQQIYEMVSDVFTRMRKPQSPFRTLLKNNSIHESFILYDSEKNSVPLSREETLEKFGKLLYAENRIQGLNDAIKSLEHLKTTWDFVEQRMIDEVFPAISIIEQTRDKIPTRNTTCKSYVNAVDYLMNFLKDLPDYATQILLHNLTAKRNLKKMFKLGDWKEIKKE